MFSERRIVPQSTPDAVIEVALDILRANGLEAVKIDNLRCAGEVSNGTLYHHFGSKEGLLRALALEVAAGYRAAVLGTDIIRAHLGWVESHPQEARLLARHGEFPAPAGWDPIEHEIRLAPARRIGDLWLEGRLPGRPSDYVDRLSRS